MTANSLMLLISILLRLMDPPHEKHSKFGHDGVGSFMCGRKVVACRHDPTQDSLPSNHHEDEDPEPLKIHAPMENTNRVFIKYFKKTKLTTLIVNREALVYTSRRMCTDQHFWSFFHANWYQLVYISKRKPVWRLSGSIGSGWPPGATSSSISSRKHVSSWS
jgi:hypothetical protein